MKWWRTCGEEQSTIKHASHTSAFTCDTSLRILCPFYISRGKERQSRREKDLLQLVHSHTHTHVLGCARVCAYTSCIWLRASLCLLQVNQQQNYNPGEPIKEEVSPASVCVCACVCTFFKNSNRVLEWWLNFSALHRGTQLKWAPLQLPHLQNKGPGVHLWQLYVRALCVKLIVREPVTRYKMVPHIKTTP